MRGLSILSQLFSKWFGVLAPFTPKILLAIFLFAKVFRPFIEIGFTGEAMVEIARNILAAELTLRSSVEQLAAGTFSYLQVLELLGAVAFIYYFIKFWGDYVFIHLTGSQAHGMAYIMSFVTFAIIEWSVVSVTGDGASFFPIKDGIWYFLQNLDLLGNFDWWPWNEPVAVSQAVDIVSNIEVNTSG